MKPKITEHAQIRMEQRAIPKLLIDLLMIKGASSHAGGDTKKYFFDYKTQKRLFKELQAMTRHWDSLCNCYLIAGEDDAVITAAHDTTRRSA